MTGRVMFLIFSKVSLWGFFEDTPSIALNLPVASAVQE